MYVPLLVLQEICHWTWFAKIARAVLSPWGVSQDRDPAPFARLFLRKPNANFKNPRFVLGQKSFQVSTCQLMFRRYLSKCIRRFQRCGLEQMNFGVATAISPSRFQRQAFQSVCNELWVFTTPGLSNWLTLVQRSLCPRRPFEVPTLLGGLSNWQSKTPGRSIDRSMWRQAAIGRATGVDEPLPPAAPGKPGGGGSHRLGFFFGFWRGGQRWVFLQVAG